MNTNTTGFICFYKSLCLCALDESSLSIRRVKEMGLFLTTDPFPLGRYQ